MSTKIRIVGESMSIPVACACGRRFKVRDDLAGGKVKCPGCGSAIGVALPSPGDDAPARDSSASIARRLDWLEAENRRLRGDLEGVRKRVWTLAIVQTAGFGLVLLAILVGLLSARDDKGPVDVPAPSPSVVVAERFVVKDRRGNVRAVLGRTGDAADDRHAETGLHLFTSGKERGQFTVGGNGFAVLTISDATEQERLVLGGGDQAPVGLSMNDAGGDPRFDMEVFVDGTPNFAVYAGDLGTRFQLGVHRNGVPYMDFFDTSKAYIPFLDREGKPLFAPR